jgi:light-regulated signal transduction histidine kinase (bacteriophytochrome)
MIHHVISLAGGNSQSLHEMGPFQDSASEGLKPEPDENILNLLKIMSHDIRSSLLSMLATLKLLSRGYYGKMDEEVAQKIKELLSNATRLNGIAEGCLGRTFAGNEEVEIVGASRVMERRERNTPNKQLSMETKGNALIL